MKLEQISRVIKSFKSLSQKQIFKHGLGLSVISAIAIVLNFLSGAVIAAALGPYARGLFQSWRVVTSIFSDISNFALSKFISSKFNVQTSIFKGVRTHLLLAYVLAAALIPLMAKLNFTNTMIFVFFLLIPIGIYTDIYWGLLIRNEKYFVITSWNFLAMAGSSFLTILLFLTQLLTLDNIIISHSIIFGLCLMFGVKNTNFPKGNLSIYKNYKKILPIYFSNIFNTIFLFLDQMIVLYFLNLSDLGIFAMALAVAGASSIITSPVATFSPLIAKKLDNQKYKFIFQILICYLVLLIIVFILCYNFLGIIVIETIGESFSPIVEIVPILFGGKLLQSFVQLLISWSIYRNESKILVTEKVLNAMGLAVACSVFLSSKSLETAAWISVITLSPSCTYFFILFLKEMMGTTTRNKSDRQ